MALDSDVQKLLQKMQAGTPTDLSRLTPADLRRSMLHLSRRLGAANTAQVLSEDIELIGAAGPLRGRSYTPLAVRNRKSPAIVYFHGGAGVFCSIDTHDGLCRLLAEASHCRVISVDYRLAPENPFPAAIEDGYAVTRRISGDAGEMGIYGDRIAIAGDSLGATIATVVAKQIGRPALALQILLCPVTDMSTMTESRRLYGTGYFFDLSLIEWAHRHYCLPDVLAADPRVSPLLADDLSGSPPVHIHTAEYDPLRDEGYAYAERLRKAGVAVSYTCHPGMIHHFYAMSGSIAYAQAALKMAGKAIEEALS